MLFNWLAEWKQIGRIISTKKRTSKRNRLHDKRVASQLEVLEDRTLLTDFLVTTLADEAFDGTESNSNGDGAGLSLREAIGLANANGGVAGQTGENDGDTISFAPGLAGGTINLSFPLGELDITDDVIIDGNVLGSRITINAGDTSRILILIRPGPPDRYSRSR